MEANDMGRGKWKFISAEPFSATKDIVTYHVHYNDIEKTVIEIQYLFPKGKRFMEDYRERVYSRRKIRGKGKWSEGRKKPRRYA
jgi:hypothetical protein